MKYKIYLDELEQSSSELINYSKKNIAEKINELNNFVDTIEWSGEAHDTYVSDYKQKIQKIKSINEKLAMFGNFLKFCKEHYGETNTKLVEMWNEFIDELRMKNEL